jgi:3-phosphoshikimate 1-carboxyvinyltransferase
MRLISTQYDYINCDITLPLSKSIVNRLLVIHHFSEGKKISELLSNSSDTVVMQNLLEKICNHTVDSESVVEINVGNAGTVMRFLIAVLAVTPGKWLITGTERMQQRPVQPLTKALQHLGADLNFQKQEGYPPILITGSKNLTGGSVELNAGISSQFISALMMLGPILKGGLEITLLGDIISSSYIHMTQSLMQKCGAKVDFEGKLVRIQEGKYQEFSICDVIEPDWSAAAFWYQVVAFNPTSRVLLRDLQNQSVQGDSVLPEIFKNLGVNSSFTEDGVLLTKSEQPVAKDFNYDFTECPDLAQAVIVACAALGISGRFAGLKTLRVKETDRIEALRCELSKLGYHVLVENDEIILSGSIAISAIENSSVVIECYDDHRMAMSFATLVLLRNDICISEPAVVKKSYPSFWEDLELAGFIYKDVD